MVLTSPFGDVPHLYTGNLVKFIQQSEHVQNKLDKKILIDAKTEESITPRQLFDGGGKISSLLSQKYGLGYDGVVCMFCPNSVYITVVHHGILGLGAVVTPANVAYLPKELHHQLSLSEASIVITAPSLRGVVDEASSLPGAKVKHVLYLDDVMKESQSYPYLAPVDLPGDLAKTKEAFYCFSSGTSGVAKGVMSTHFNMTSNVQQLEYSASFSNNSDPSEGVGIGFLPMTHMYGLMKITNLVPYFASCSIVMEKFDFELLLKSIMKYKIKGLPVVPPIAVLLAKHPLVEKYPIHEIVEEVYSGAAPLSDSVVKELTTRLGCVIKQGYGLTETSPSCHNTSFDESIYNPDSVGWLISSMEARIVDSEGNDVPVGERGELWVKGPNIMKGYLKNPEATAATMSPDGFFKTGDVAIVDKTGQYYIVDRLKELIKSHGFQVAPAEIEAILLSHPHVADAAVIGHFVEEISAEHPRAFIQLKDETADPLEIKSWFDSRVARHKRLWGGIVILDAIPKNPSGKILRRELRARKDSNVHGYTKAKL